jgi:nuclear cap-binding protein subunit 1
VALITIFTNSVNPEITTDTLKRVTARTEDALKAGKWAEFKLFLRFLACCQPVFKGDGVFDFLEQLFDTVVDLQSANENDVVGIELVKIILLTIPYAIWSGGSRFHQSAQKLLDKTGIVAGNMLPMEGLIHTYATNNEGEEIPMAYHSVIGLLQSQLTNEAAAGWPLSFMRPLSSFPPEQSKLDEPHSHEFPSFTIPSPVNPGPNPVFPEAYFSLYTGQDIESVPRLSDIAASLIRDSIVDTIDQLDFNREAAAKFLIDLDQFWVKDKFAQRGMTFDTFKEKVKAGEEIWKPEDIIVEAIFSQLLKLPNPQHKLVYYHSLITECCKLAPSAIAPSLGRAIRTIYKYLDIVDLELAYRFLDWFSHHVSNFDFRWRWNEWYAFE